MVSAGPAAKNLLLSFAKEHTMQASSISTDSYAKVIANSRRVRWSIEDDVVRGRRFDLSKPFLPSGLSLAGELPFLRDGDRRLFSQIQGRSYAYIFGLVERFISVKMLEVSHAHALGDQVALEALVRMTQAHCRASIAPEADICELWRDVFLFHWKEEPQHAVLDELEFLSADALLTPAQRDTAVGELIELMGAVDQKAYRWQYIVSGVMQPRFQKVLFATMSPGQVERVNGALAPLLATAPAEASRMAELA